MNKTWYLIAYDIADPKRLKRVHRYLKAKASPLQLSVHALHGSEAELSETLTGLERLMNRREDDLRAWPIAHPGDLWYIGNFKWQGKLISDRPKAETNGIVQRVRKLLRRKPAKPNKPEVRS